jgi:hypothetical protein
MLQVLTTFTSDARDLLQASDCVSLTAYQSTHCHGCMLQVLTTFTSDARDLLEVRRSEASLKGRVAELTSRRKVSPLRHKSNMVGHTYVRTCSARVKMCSTCMLDMLYMLGVLFGLTAAY